MYFATLVGLVAGVVARDATHDSFVHLPVSRFAIEPDAIARTGQGLSRRDGSFDVPLVNNHSAYTIDLELGTPPQQLSLVLDTGSSATVVFNQWQCSRVRRCSPGSLFLEDDSSTYRANGTGFKESLLNDLGGYSGTWSQETLLLGNHNITNFNFALVNNSNLPTGAVGLAPATGEREFMVGNINKPYPSLPQQLKEQGVIQQEAFSLWLNSEGAGEILFGGIDDAKFTTDLYRLPLLPTDDNSTVTQFAVQLTGLSIYDGDGNEQLFTTCDMPVVLNTGSPISALPLDLIGPFYETLGVIDYDTDAYAVETYVVPCDALSSADGGLGLHLGSGLDVTVGFSDLFTKVGVADSDGVEYCVPGFLLTTDWPAVIGENVLRKLYVVYDLENLEVGIAPAQTGSAASSTSIQALSTGIPGALISNVLNSTGGEDYDFATRPVTITMPTRVSSLESTPLSNWGEVSPTFTFDTEVTRLSSLDSLPLSTWGYTHVSWTARASVTQSVIIGAKSGAISTKGASSKGNDTSSESSNTTSATSGIVSGGAVGTASGTNAERSSVAGASSSTASTTAGASGGSTPTTSASQTQGDANRQPTGSSGASTGSAAAASSSPVQASGGGGGGQSSTGGASITKASSLLATLAGIMLTLM